MQNKDSVFISFSKRFTEQVARVIYDTLISLYPDSSKVNIFFSSLSMQAGRFEEQILNNLKTTKIGITVLTPEHIYQPSPWLMYEAGALSMMVEANGGKLIPYLFCRHKEDIEAPLQSHQYYQYQLNSGDNLGQFTTFVLQVNQLLSEENQINAHTLRGEVVRMWNDGIHKQFKDIANSLYDPSISAIAKMTDSKENLVFNTDVLSTSEQGISPLFDDFNPKTPAEIEHSFERVLQLYIPESWKKQTPEDTKYNATRVIINNTRISTFIVFTDGNNILLFDRAKAESLTNVINNRFDVFGSVQFENRSLAKKIDSVDFLNAPIQKIQPLYGAAFENNRYRTQGDVETVVMFGTVVYLLPEDLALAKTSSNQALTLLSLQKAKTLPSEKLTSKAFLAISQL